MFLRCCINKFKLLVVNKQGKKGKRNEQKEGKVRARG
jgi:hypothetical protein